MSTFFIIFPSLSNLWNWNSYQTLFRISSSDELGENGIVSSVKQIKQSEKNSGESIR